MYRTAGRMHCFDLRMRVAHIAYFARINSGHTQHKFLVADAARYFRVIQTYLVNLEIDFFHDLRADS